MATIQDDASGDLDNILDVSAIYKRHSLKGTSIRLLKILPSTNTDDTISCQLSVVSLEDSPEYRALSYAWGELSTTKVVLIDGSPFRVRINLWNFLSQARTEGYDGPLWIDAICINQEDLTERGEQVAFMGRIYSQATSVRAWLGVGTERHLLAMQNISSVDWSAAEVAGASDCLQQGVFDLESFVTDEWFAPILELFEEVDYWSRIWVVQEFCLATNLAVQCGSLLIEAAVLTTFEFVLWEIVEWREKISTDSFKEGMVKREPTRDIRRSPASSLIRARRLKPVEIFSFSYIVVDFDYSQCTDLHDYVYGFLSLIDVLSTNIKPDYTKPMVQLYLDVAEVLKYECANGEKAEMFYAYIAAHYLIGRLELSHKIPEVQEVLTRFPNPL